MRKAVTPGGEPAKDGSGRRYWVRANPAAPKAVDDDAPKRPPKARFLEPYRLGEETRAALLDALIAADLGDPESRDLFLTAIEYDIARFRQSYPVSERTPDPQPAPSAPAASPLSPGLPESPESPPAPAGTPGGPALPRAKCALQALPKPAPQPVAVSIPGAARALADAIAALDGAGRAALAAALQSVDPFRRGYDAGYLDALCQELARLGSVPDAAAAAAPDPAAVPTPSDGPPDALPATPPATPGTIGGQTPAKAGPPPAPDPPLGESDRRFVRRVARIYEQCLEVRAGVAPGNPFLAVLRVLAPEAGVRLPADPQALALPSP